MSFPKSGGSDFMPGGIKLTCVPATALKAELDDCRLDNRAYQDIPIKLTFAANFEVDWCADNEAIDGWLLEMLVDKRNSSYTLSCLITHYTDYDGTRRKVTGYQTRKYTGSPALRDKVAADATPYNTVKPNNTYGDGAIFAIDSTNAEVDILI